MVVSNEATGLYFIKWKQMPLIQMRCFTFSWFAKLFFVKINRSTKHWESQRFCDVNSNTKLYCRSLQSKYKMTQFFKQCMYFNILGTIFASNANILKAIKLLFLYLILMCLNFPVFFVGMEPQLFYGKQWRSTSPWRLTVWNNLKLTTFI